MPTASSVAAEYALLRNACGVLTSVDAALVEFAGEDRLAWLQGQVTADLSALSPGSASAFCFVEPTGQMKAVCQAWCFPNSVWMTTQKACVQAVLDRAEQMVIMEDVAARELSGAYDLVSVQGPGATDALRGLGLPDAFSDAAALSIDGQSCYICASDRGGSGGWDAWLPLGSSLAAQWRAGLPKIGAEALEIARLETGIPIFGKDMDGKTLPPELGPAFERARISYAKGCYTGQEVMMRIHSRGHTNRQWMGLIAEGPLEAGAPVIAQGEKAGIVTSAAISPTLGPIAAAMLKSSAVQTGGAVSVGPFKAQICEFPLIAAN